MSVPRKSAFPEEAYPEDDPGKLSFERAMYSDIILTAEIARIVYDPNGNESMIGAAFERANQYVRDNINDRGAVAEVEFVYQDVRYSVRGEGI